MANNLDQTGVMQVDGAWATSVKYAADALGPNVGAVELRFMQGRAEVGRVAVSREHLSELLGEKNRSAIERHIANDADKYLAVVSGELPVLDDGDQAVGGAGRGELRRAGQLQPAIYCAREAGGQTCVSGDRRCA